MHDDNQKPIGVHPPAFALSETDRYLSCAWVEFGGVTDAAKGIKAAASCIRSRRTVKKSDGFVMGAACAIRATGAAKGHGLKVVWAGKRGDAYSKVIGMPDKLGPIHEILASDVWCTIILATDTE